MEITIVKNEYGTHVNYPKDFTLDNFRALTIEEQDKLCEEIISQVVEKFAQDGIKVSSDAIRHNLYAWTYECKSGYRDEANNLYITSPCGDYNPLTFCASKIDRNDLITYMA